MRTFMMILAAVFTIAIAQFNVASADARTTPGAQSSKVSNKSSYRKRRYRARRYRARRSLRQRRWRNRQVSSRRAGRNRRYRTRRYRNRRVVSSRRMRNRRNRSRRVASRRSHRASRSLRSRMIPVRPYPIRRRARGSVMRGVASYYWQPQRVASGGWFNPNALTAAHRTLPFGTRIRVTNLNNGRSVVVRINDRGPYIRGRNLDLSRRAATIIGMRKSGVAPVRMTVL